MPDSILAMHVRTNVPRPCDRADRPKPEPVAAAQIVDEEAQRPAESPELMISVVDDSENVRVIVRNQNSNTNALEKTINIKAASKNQKCSLDTKEILKKHFFGMGYPYFITGYEKHVAVTTDYGILLF